MAKASQVVIMEGEYYIIKAPNGKVLEVKDFNTENGAGIQLWSYAGHPWQQWQFVDAGEGRWRIQNRFTGKMIDLALGGVLEGTRRMTRIINSLKKSVERPRLMHYALGHDVLKLEDDVRHED